MGRASTLGAVGAALGALGVLVLSLPRITNKTTTTININAIIPSTSGEYNISHGAGFGSAVIAAFSAWTARSRANA
jgi:hypothetical protein